MAAKRIPIPEPAVAYFNGQYPDKRKIEEVSGGGDEKHSYSDDLDPIRIRPRSIGADSHGGLWSQGFQVRREAGRCPAHNRATRFREGAGLFDPGHWRNELSGSLPDHQDRARRNLGGGKSAQFLFLGVGGAG